MPLKPSLQVHLVDGLMLAEFWDCLRLDPAPIHELQQRYDEHVRDGGRPDLVIDLQGVGFAGSAALGGFLKVHRAASKAGGRVVFCRVDPMVRDVFRVSQIEPFFRFEADRDAAIGNLNAPRADAKPGADADGPALPRPARPAPAPGPLRRPRRDKNTGG